MERPAGALSGRRFLVLELEDAELREALAHVRVRARALRGARHPPVRERGTVGLKALRRAAPWAVTLAIFAFLFWRIPLGSVADTLAAAQWGRYLLLMVPYSLFYFLVDSFVVQQAVSWFNVRVPYRDILPVRATTYILSLLASPTVTSCPCAPPPTSCRCLTRSSARAGSRSTCTAATASPSGRSPAR